MRKVFTLAKWEFFEKIKRKSFLVYMFVFPALIILLGLLPKLISDNSKESTKAIGIVDNTRKFFPYLSDKLDELILPDNQPRYITVNFNKEKNPEDNINSANNEIKKGTIDGYLLIKNENGKISLQYRSKNVSGFTDTKLFESAFNEVLTEFNLVQKGIPRSMSKEVVGDVKITSVQIKDNGEEEEKDFLSIFFQSYILLMLLTMTIVFSGGTFVRSLINEKANGILEVILSSLNVDQLLSGKILGLIYLSLFQFGIWALIGYLLSQNSILFSFEITQTFLLQMLYFVLGYVLFIALLVGFGSIVSTEQGAQQLTGILTIVLIFPVVIASIVVQNPESFFAQVLTYFPLTLPSMQLLKLNFYNPPLWEILATIFILIISIYFVIKFSSRIFKIGVLHFDKQPALKLLKRILN